MQLEDHRLRYKELQNERCSTESIPLQPLGSPYHIYPSNNLPAVRAFHANPSLQHMSSSPLLSSRVHLEMSPLSILKERGAHMQHSQARTANMSRRSTIQETSFSKQSDTDAVVSKIQNMFPTAGENHIRLLLKRYYNSEAVVISALQVDKYPVTMPGPFVTPPAQRHLYHSNSAFYMTPPARRLDVGLMAARGHGSHSTRTCSPVPGGRFGGVMSMQSGIRSGGGGDINNFGYTALQSFQYGGSPQWRSSPKPHSSPKMKLRYMKNIFPKADEMLLLDILAGADNSVQKASDALIALGYTKREIAPPKPSRAEKPKDEIIIPLRPKEYTQAEMHSMQQLLKEKYPQIAERIILMALESVNYAEDRADQILQIVHEEDVTRASMHATKLSPRPLAPQNDKKTITDGDIGDAVDNILTVVLETTEDNKAATHLSSSTATTQIILSNSSTICMGNEAHSSQTTTSTATTSTQNCISSSPPSTPFSSSTPPSASSSFETITTKGILEHSKRSSAIGLRGYLHGCSFSSASLMDKIRLSRPRNRDKSDSLKLSQRGSTEDDSENLLQHHQEFKSLLPRTAPLGHNSKLAKGPDEHLLLADYITWNGANPDISISQKKVAAGPDETLRNERTYLARGRNPELCKGAKGGLAKGSIYAQLSSSTNIKCN